MNETLRINEDLTASCFDCDNAVNGRPGSDYCKDCLLYGIYMATLEGFKGEK